MVLMFSKVEARNWCLRAKCINLDTSEFYPGRGESTVVIKTICRGCSVVKPCLEFAMRNKERFGIWGATSERERRKMRSAQHRNAKKEIEVPITQLMDKFGIHISFLEESELEDFSGKDGYE